MSACFLYGAAGTGASGTSEPIVGLNILYGGERPQTAEPDTVWVSTASASGAYVIAPSAPEGTEGQVWFQTGDGGLTITMQSPVKAVFPLINAYVYRNGEWKFIDEAAIYKDGTWILFCERCLKLYEPGDLCTDVTGGYNNDEPVYDLTGLIPPVYREDCVVFESAPNNLPYMVTNKRLVLDKYSKLVVDWYVEQNALPNTELSLSLTVFDIRKKTKLADLSYGGADIRRTDVLDIKNLTGECYISVRSRVYSNGGTKYPNMKGYLYSLEMMV